MDRSFVAVILMRRRNVLLAAAGMAALAVALFAGLGLASDGAQLRLAGTSLNGSPAPNFRLDGSGGQPYSLAQFRGKVVVLTFLYSHCTDVCPLTAELLRHADEAAGHPADVIYVAVSVDPAGDTPQNVAAFEAKHQLGELGNRWHYLVGSRSDLQPVWRSYGIYAPRQPVTGGAPDHSTGIYFIDKQGRERAFGDVTLSAEGVARNELILAKQ